MRISDPHSGRRGWTWVEIAAVVAVVGLLVEQHTVVGTGNAEANYPRTWHARINTAAYNFRCVSSQHFESRTHLAERRGYVGTADSLTSMR